MTVGQVVNLPSEQVSNLLYPYPTAGRTIRPLFTSMPAIEVALRLPAVFLYLDYDRSHSLDCYLRQT